MLRKLRTDRLVVVTEQNMDFVFAISDSVYVLRREGVEADLTTLRLLDDERRSRIQRLYAEDRQSDADQLARAALVA
jgi:ABC-type branched-subunit amino acid transport system ATPase component